MSNRRNPSHPVIGFLVSNMKLYEEFELANMCKNALKTLALTFYSLKPETKKENKDFISELVKIIKLRNKLRGQSYSDTMGKQDAYDRDMELTYMELYNELSNILWKGNYLMERSYRPETKDSGVFG